MDKPATVGDTDLVGIHSFRDEGHVLGAGFEDHPIVGIDPNADPYRLACMIAGRLEDAFDMGKALHFSLDAGVEGADLASAPLMNQLDELFKLQMVLVGALRASIKDKSSE